MEAPPAKPDPGGDRGIALGLGPEPLDGPGGSALRYAAMVRHALAHGIDRFDLTDARTLRLALDVTRVAAETGWAQATVFQSALPDVGGTSPATAPAQTVRFREARAGASRAPVPRGVVDGVRYPSLELAEAESIRAVDEGARWIAFPGHLLEARRVEVLVREVRRGGAQVLATNPFADGRLDGRWLAEGTLAPSGPARPLDLAALQREYAPVLPLGFLTEGRRRTLPQAAVGFLRAIGAVASVRFRDPRQIAELVDAPGAGPLSASELGRLAALGDAPRSP